MPIYEFECNDCGHEFEVLMRITEFDPKKVICEKCSSKNVSQVFSHFNVKTSKKS